MQKTNPEKIMAIKNFLRNASQQSKSVEQLRQEELATAASIPSLPGIITELTTVAGLNAEWVFSESLPENSRNVILYYHGGAFVSGSCRSHRDIASRISLASETKVLLVEYRLAPEHQYPAANEDCLLSYRWLIDHGIPAENIILGGDSIGGYLVLMTLLALRNTTYAMPKAAFLLSPHTDFLYLDGESFETKLLVDPSNSKEAIKQCAQNYFGAGMQLPSVLSPLNEDLTGLPPLFIQVGADEVILDDSTRLYDWAKDAGVDAKLEVWEDMWHIFRFMAYMLPEGQEAIYHIGEFVKAQFS